MAALDDIASVSPYAVSEEGEAALWRAFKADQSAMARGRLFDLHSAFARQVAAKHFRDRKSGDIEFSDLCQLGYTGLLEALDRYDPDRGVPFRPFARRRISGSILDGLAHMSELREQLSFRQRARKERLKSLYDVDPATLDDSEAMLALIEMATGLALGFMIEGSGLYVTQDETDKRFSPYESLAWKEMTLSLRARIADLSDQQSRVIRYHYLEGLTFEQISRAFGLTKGRISQIHKAALKSLKDQFYTGPAFKLEK